MTFQVVPPRRQPVFCDIVRVVVLHSHPEGDLVCELETWLQGSLSSRLRGWEVEGWRPWSALPKDGE